MKTFYRNLLPLSLFFLTGAALILSVTLFLSGCSSSMEYKEQKFDPALKDRIRNAEQNNPEEVIHVFIRTDKELNYEMRTDIENHGIVIETAADTIITAAGTSEQLKNAAGLPFIVKIELSHTRKI